MGKLEDWRNFLTVIAPQCFSSTLENGCSQFDACIIDAMQFIVPVFQNKDYPNFEPDYLLQRMNQVVQYYMNPARNEKRPLINRITTFLLDTPHHVPKNKAATQQSRDKTKDDTPSYMNEELYYKILNECGGGDAIQDSPLFINYDEEMKCTIPCSIIRRSVNLNFQLYRLLTHHLLQTTKVPDNQVLIIDGGIAINTERFKIVREAIIRDNHWKELSLYKQECLLYRFLNEAHYHTKFTLYTDGTFNRFIPRDTVELKEGTHDVGEADIKIQRYITPNNGLKRYLIVSQDTDIIFILLLHMGYFLGQHTKEEIEELEIFLDTDTSLGYREARSYRYINIKRLYFAIIDLFTKEFPSVISPVEVFVFIVFSLQTDFTKKFDSCLRIGPAAMWNTFSSLHTSPGIKEGYICFGNKLKRSGSVTKRTPLTNILSSAIRYDDNKGVFQLDHPAISQFYYFLCQSSLVATRKNLKLPNHSVQTVIKPYELQIYGKEIMERLYYYEKGSLPKNTNHQEEITMDMIFDNPSLSSLIYEENTMKSYINNNKEALAVVAKKKPPPLFGILTEDQMNRRILQILWYMIYCRNGWRARSIVYSYVHYGWQEEEIDKEEEDSIINNTICDSKYKHGQFHFYRVKNNEPL